ncbi:MAG: hypothetical protein AAB549_01645 [Patescibacteria group bacterium]
MVTQDSSTIKVYGYPYGPSDTAAVKASRLTFAKNYAKRNTLTGTAPVVVARTGGSEVRWQTTKYYSGQTGQVDMIFTTTGYYVLICSAPTSTFSAFQSTCITMVKSFKQVTPFTMSSYTYPTLKTTYKLPSKLWKIIRQDKSSRIFYRQDDVLALSNSTWIEVITQDPTLYVKDEKTAITNGNTTGFASTMKKRCQKTYPWLTCTVSNVQSVKKGIYRGMQYRLKKVANGTTNYEDGLDILRGQLLLQFHYVGDASYFQQMRSEFQLLIDSISVK